MGVFNNKKLKKVIFRKDALQHLTKETVQKLVLVQEIVIMDAFNFQRKRVEHHRTTGRN